MTTIACDGKSMSGDGRETAADTIVGSARQKVWKLDDGRLVGAAGMSREVELFMEWLLDEDVPCPKLKEMGALVLETNGTILIFNDSCVSSVSEAPAALGTGKQHALTAMDMGADSRKAVQMAIKRDPFSGGLIRTVKL